MLANVQNDYHRLKVEYEKVVWATAKNQEDLHTCKNKLKKASEVVKGYRDSLLALEKKKKKKRVC